MAVLKAKGPYGRARRPLQTWGNCLVSDRSEIRSNAIPVAMLLAAANPERGCSVQNVRFHCCAVKLGIAGGPNRGLNAALLLVQANPEIEPANGFSGLSRSPLFSSRCASLGSLSRSLDP